MDDPTQISTPATPDPSQADQTSADVTPQTATAFVARVNTTLLGFFDNANDAADAIRAYQMGNAVNIDDEFEVATYSPI